jgi:hypothetical protein
MTVPVPLRDVAHARAGDKGNDCLLVLSPYDHEDFAQLLMAVTAERVGAHFGAPEPGRVTITPAPALAALVVVVRDRLFGGVTRSTGADPHGKTLSSHLLDLRVPWFDRSAPMSSSARLEGRPN